ncbi:MAG: PQQ-binding-like beta-propeller repeat protein [Bacteroidetes bacterium]|nr:PQQ-binding-like beta-propeller repeat protein [Bacteroidota bacterium]
MSIQIRDTFILPGIPYSKTVHFNGKNVYYQSMDEPDKETFKSFSLEHNKLVWSKDINQIGINEGAITITGEYVVPTLSDTVYLIDAEGKARILKLEYRSKTNPLVYKNMFILQDRGIGLKCFDAVTLKLIWLIKQKSNFTMSQPLLLDSSIVYVLDDNSIQSSNARSGNLNWSISLQDTFAIYDLYGVYQDLIFILSTNLKKEKKITAINHKNGTQIWKVMVDNSINEFEKDMVVANDIIFCRGDSSVFTFSVKEGKPLRIYNYNSRITTNLVVDKNGNVLFGLADNTLMKIDKNRNELSITTFKSKLDRLYRFKDYIFLYSYPNLYSMDSKLSVKL